MTELNTLKVELVIKGEIFPRASAELKKSIGSILSNFFKKGRFFLEIIVISPQKIRQFNLKYRGKDSLGEVLSFPLFKNKKEIKTFLKNQKIHPLLLGTICLCPSFIKKNLKSTPLEKNSLTRRGMFLTGSKSQKEYERRVLELIHHSTRHLLGKHH